LEPKLELLGAKTANLKLCMQLEKLYSSTIQLKNIFKKAILLLSMFFLTKTIVAGSLEEA